MSLALLLTLALPIRTWRTGRSPVPALAFEPPDALPAPRPRIWVDTDAACGHDERTDVDDCLALLLLARTAGIEVVGVSTVFGNASLAVTDRTTRALVELLWTEPASRPPVYAGAGQPRDGRRTPETEGRRALRRALEREPLTVLALGPLTTVADALDGRPDLRRHVDRVVAVMGRREGHLFHPSEGSSDKAAAAALLAMDLPVTLVPYDAARAVEITSPDLDRLAMTGRAGAWIAERSRGWLRYWRTHIGRAGFYPFDALAAAYLRAPRQLRCARVLARVHDPPLSIPFCRPSGLLVTQRPDGGSRAAGSPALYCPALSETFASRLRGWLLGTSTSSCAHPLSRARAQAHGRACRHVLTFRRTAPIPAGQW